VEALSALVKRSGAAGSVSLAIAIVNQKQIAFDPLRVEATSRSPLRTVTTDASRRSTG
jgi:hypothetical protein